jgi:hypothetical protein
VNLHTLRCLENNIELPDYGDTFFDHCCSGVAFTKESNKIAQKNPPLWNSIQIYRKEREIVGLKEVPNLVGFPNLKRELRNQMVVNAAVMIREHFKKRMRKYMEVKFGKKKVQEIIRACYNILESDVSEVKHMRSMLTPDGAKSSDKWIPWPMNITKNRPMKRPRGSRPLFWTLLTRNKYHIKFTFSVLQYTNIILRSTLTL